MTVDHAGMRRLAISAGRTDIAAGRLVTVADIDAWIERIGTRQELAPPQSISS